MLSGLSERLSTSLSYTLDTSLASPESSVSEALREVTERGRKGTYSWRFKKGWSRGGEMDIWWCSSSNYFYLCYPLGKKDIKTGSVVWTLPSFVRGARRGMLLLFSLQSCPALCDPMDCSISGIPVLHCLPELGQTHVHWVSDAIQLSHLLSSPSPPDFNLSQH